QSTRNLTHVAWALVAGVLMFLVWEVADRRNPAATLLEFDLVTPPQTATAPFRYERVTITLTPRAGRLATAQVSRRALPLPTFLRQAPLEQHPRGSSGDSATLWTILPPALDPNGPSSMYL